MAARHGVCGERRVPLRGWEELLDSIYSSWRHFSLNLFSSASAPGHQHPPWGLCQPHRSDTSHFMCRQQRTLRCMLVACPHLVPDNAMFLSILDLAALSSFLLSSHGSPFSKGIGFCKWLAASREDLLLPAWRDGSCCSHIYSRSFECWERWQRHTLKSRGVGTHHIRPVQGPSYLQPRLSLEICWSHLRIQRC